MALHGEYKYPLATFARMLKEEMEDAPCLHTLRNWRSVGVPSNTGKIVFLETVRIGGKRYTSREAYSRFLEAINEED